MKLAVLSRAPNAYSTRRFKEAALQRGHEVKVLNTLKFAIDLRKGIPDLYFRQKPLSHYDAVLPRIGTSVTYFGTAVVRQFQQMDVFCAEFPGQASQLADSQSPSYRHTSDDFREGQERCDTGHRACGRRSCCDQAD